MFSKSVALAVLGLTGLVAGDPTWPASTDELEEIMYQLNSFKARKFSDTVSPCSNEASGPGRQNAAEWLRVGFHDMSTANTYFNTGGLDGSLQYELENGENTGPGHKTTLEFMAKYLSPRSSLADLIAAGVYASVRSCGGPVVPVRGGRIDATEAGNTGVPQPQNSAFMFTQQFDRMGFNNVEMIQVTACGHTLGGVHHTEFPEIILDANVNNGLGGLDSSVAVFDNKVVTEYLDGSTTNPLVVGPAVKINKNSDFKVYNSDGNKTMEALAQKDKFNQVCKTVLQKMIDVVPKGVNLTEPIVPYKVKPVDLQLLLADGGANLHFSGYIRLKTTDLPKDSVKDLTLSYKNRKGESKCGNGGCTIKASIHGLGQGFDDTFGFFPIDAKIPVDTGISSFTVTINHADGTQQTVDNNGNGYPIQDTVLFQKPQSCILGSTGAATIVAAVRNDAVPNGAKATIHYKTAQKDSPAPKLNSVNLDLEKGQCVGQYTLFKIDHKIEGGMAYQSYVDLSSGQASDSFNAVTDIGGPCAEFQHPRSCSGVVDPGQDKDNRTTSATSTGPATSTTLGLNSTLSVTTSNTATSQDSSTAPTSTLTQSSASNTSVPVTTGTLYPTSIPTTSLTLSTSITTIPTTASNPTRTRQTALGSYTMVSCWSEGRYRALAGSSTADDEMTPEKCMKFCKGYNYWGTEFGRECKLPISPPSARLTCTGYCGNSLGHDSKKAPLEECSMACSGDSSKYCGSGNRLELYATTARIAKPTGSLSRLLRRRTPSAA